ERSVTLGIMAATLAGLRGAHTVTGEDRAGDAADALTALLTSTFGAHQYQRYRRGGGADSARAIFAATGCGGIIGTRLLNFPRTGPGRGARSGSRGAGVAGRPPHRGGLPAGEGAVRRTPGRGRSPGLDGRQRAAGHRSPDLIPERGSEEDRGQLTHLPETRGG